jgi:elongation factor 1-alpha
MDLVDYKEEVYAKLKTNIRNLLASIGYKNVDQIPIIPLSAFYGEGVTKPSERMRWYKGPVFTQALEELREPPKPTDKPLRIPIQDVYSITGVGTVPIGRVETGVLKTGDTVVFEPAGVKGEVKSIEMHHETIPQAEPGDNIGFNVRGVAKDQLRRGDVAGHPADPPTVAREFIAKIVVLTSPGDIEPGFTPTFHCHAAHVPGRITQILQKIDPKTGGVLDENPRSIRRGDVAVIRVAVLKPLVIEQATRIPQLSRFAIRHAGQTIAAGICTDVVPARS